MEKGAREGITREEMTRDGMTSKGMTRGASFLGANVLPFITPEVVFRILLKTSYVPTISNSVSNCTYELLSKMPLSASSVLKK